MAQSVKDRFDYGKNLDKAQDDYLILGMVTNSFEVRRMPLATSSVAETQIRLGQMSGEILRERVFYRVAAM